MSTEHRLVRAAMASAKLPDAVARGLRGAINGAWLGALSADALRALDEHYYNESGVYRTDGWNERGLFAWERQLIDEHFAPGSRVLVAGCGGGREVLALLESGYDVTGCDPHPGLVVWAQGFLAARGHEGRVRACERDALLADVACDGIVIGWGAYGLIHGRERRMAFLRDAAKRLPSGGPLLVSCFERPVLGRELRLTLALANALRRALGREPLELGDTLAPNRVHVFTQARLAAELAEVGFELAAMQVVAREDDTNHLGAVARAA